MPRKGLKKPELEGRSHRKRKNRTSHPKGIFKEGEIGKTSNRRTVEKICVDFVVSVF